MFGGRIKLSEKWIHKAIALVFAFVAVVGIITSIQMNMVNRSLWLDEGHLSYSFSQRSIWKLWNGALERGQSAPLGWLYFEKLLTVAFGNTEFVLRLSSVLAYTGTILLLYYILRYFIGTSIVTGAAAAAFYANMPFALKYSNVFKPYCSDGFFVLLVIFLFCLHRNGQLKTWALILCWSVIIWFSNPACFFEGGLIIEESILILEARKWKHLKSVIIVTLCILASFIVYYFFWLKVTATSDYMQSYWKGQNFPLFARTIEDLKKAGNMVEELFRHFSPFSTIMVVLTVLSLIVIGMKRNQLSIGFLVCLLITCFASSINMFPVEDRMWFFFYPFIILVVFAGLYEISRMNVLSSSILFGMIVGCEVLEVTHSLFFCLLLTVGIPFTVYIFRLEKKKKNAGNLKKILLLSSISILVFSMTGIKQYFNHPENVYWSGEEINYELDYLKEHVKSEEMVYVFTQNVDAYQYKMGYDNHSIGGYQDNVIYGTKHLNDNIDCKDEIDSLLSHDKVWIVVAHFKYDWIGKLIQTAQSSGSLELVSYEYETPLWYWCRNREDSKIHVDCIIAKEEKKEGKALYHIQLINDGEAYINHECETVKLMLSDQEEGIEIPKNVMPGSIIELQVESEVQNPDKLILKNEFGIIQELPLRGTQLNK